MFSKVAPRDFDLVCLGNHIEASSLGDWEVGGQSITLELILFSWSIILYHICGSYI